MAISGGNLYRKSSFLLDKLGKQILPEWLTIQEFPTCWGLASTPFDGEGVLTRDMDIVRNGELMSWLLTSYSARKLGLTTTATPAASTTGRFPAPVRISMACSRRWAPACW